MNIQINQYGKILEGDYKGWFVFIQDDKENTGGYLILLTQTKKNSDIGYDDWVENYEDLEKLLI